MANEALENCPLSERANRDNPHNEGTAWCYQLHDSLRILWSLCYNPDPVSTSNQLHTIEMQLEHTREAITRDLKRINQTKQTGCKTGKCCKVKAPRYKRIISKKST